ncbi:DMT family transporter [Crenobacter cavernae]|uniref:DMT family transporter n=1 Tax=Crenobacter cavernae TaxID=2290923 RepID=A0ABY0FDT3_9NEIS|nr:DMT family transporter [Crenobacter cavernae]RXZ42778.1 DMT family transporter [Crenobacter cavernae]
MSSQHKHLGWIPWAFVVLWSTGFIGAKLGLPYIGPFTFLAVRMALTLAGFAVLMRVYAVPWPSLPVARRQWISGLLVHGVYLGGVFAAIKAQVPAGLTALIVGLQPLLTALVSHIAFAERLARRQWLGMAVGFAGTVLVVAGTRGLDFHAGYGLVWTVFALLGITTGTLYQKRHSGGTHLLAGTFHQYLATLVFTGALALLLEYDQPVVWSAELWVAMIWSVLALSVAAILLLMRMIKEGEVARVVSYFYLVPGLTALEAWALFDERLSAAALAGMALAAAGVALVLRVPARSARV